LFDRESDREAVSLFLNWFKQLSEHGKIEKVDYKSLEKIYTNKEEVRSMLIKALEKERKEIFKKGKIEGKIEGKVEAAKNLLAEGLSVSFISKVTGFSEAEILKLQSKM
jgi:predicted transposase/invertase (TIGR01784 family)